MGLLAMLKNLDREVQVRTVSGLLNLPLQLLQPRLGKKIQSVIRDRHKKMPLSVCFEYVLLQAATDVRFRLLY